MSLNGLDDPAVIEAYQSALSEAGGWFLLQYTSRSDIGLLSRGTGSVPELRNALQKQEDEAESPVPLYGFLQYRRRKIVFKYVPEAASRLLQARVAVHFQSILDKFSPHDTVFPMTAPTDLTESAMSSACLLHAASASMTSSNSSLRRKRLVEITEDTEDQDDERPATAATSPTVHHDAARAALEDKSEDKGEEAVTPTLHNTSRPTTARTISKDTVPASSLSKSLPQAPSETVAATDATTTAADTTPVQQESQATTATPSKPSTPVPQADLDSEAALAEEKRLFLEERAAQRRAQREAEEAAAALERPSFDSSSRRQSSSSTRHEFNYSGYKPKVKYGPRPSLDMNGRPRTAGSLVRQHGEPRPIAALPAGFRSSSSRSTTSNSSHTTTTNIFKPQSHLQHTPTSRPTSSQSSAPAFHSPLTPPSSSPNNTPSPMMQFTSRPLPPPIPGGAHRAPSVRSVTSTRTTAKSPGLTPEKARLMKALELKRRKEREAAEKEEKRREAAEAQAKTEAEEEARKMQEGGEETSSKEEEALKKEEEKEEVLDDGDNDNLNIAQTGLLPPVEEDQVEAEAEQSEASKNEQVQTVAEESIETPATTSKEEAIATESPSKPELKEEAQEEISAEPSSIEAEKEKAPDFSAADVEEEVVAGQTEEQTSETVVPEEGKVEEVVEAAVPAAAAAASASEEVTEVESGPVDEEEKGTAVVEEVEEEQSGAGSEETIASNLTAVEEAESEKKPLASGAVEEPVEAPAELPVEALVAEQEPVEAIEEPVAASEPAIEPATAEAEIIESQVETATTEPEAEATEEPTTTETSAEPVPAEVESAVLDDSTEEQQAEQSPEALPSAAADNEEETKPVTETTSDHVSEPGRATPAADSLSSTPSTVITSSNNGKTPTALDSPTSPTTTPTAIPQIIADPKDETDSAPISDASASHSRSTSISIPAATTSTKQKRTSILSLAKRFSIAGTSDGFVSDDDLLDELTSAEVHEARPVQVSRSPVSPVFDAALQDGGAGANVGTGARSASNPMLMPSRNLSADSALLLGNRSASATYGGNGNGNGSGNGNLSGARVLTAKKVNVSSGISRRIAALNDKFSTQPINPTATLTGLAAPSSPFETLRRKVSVNGNTTVPRPVSPYGFGMPAPATAPTPPERSAARPTASRWKTDSVTVTAHIIRDPAAPKEALLSSSPESTPLNLQKSPLVVEHESSSEPQTLQQQQPFRTQRSSSIQSTSTIAKSEKVDTSKMRRESVSSSPSSRRSSITFTAGSIPGSKTDSRTSIARSRNPDAPLSRSTSDLSTGSPLSAVDETSSETSDKRSRSSEKGEKESRKQRIMRRMSNITTSSRRSILSAFSPTLKEEDTSKPSSSPSTPSSATITEDPTETTLGPLNVQFPDTLLFKRRLLTFSPSTQTITLSPPPSDASRNLAVTKKYQLSEFLRPCVPDHERMELPNSVLLEFRDGRTLVLGCEGVAGANGQRRVLGLLVKGWEVVQESEV